MAPLSEVKSMLAQVTNQAQPFRTFISKQNFATTEAV